MTARHGFGIGIAAVVLLAGCPKNTEIANGGTSQGGGSYNGSSGSSGGAGSGSGSGSGSGMKGTGTGGSGSGTVTLDAGVPGSGGSAGASGGGSGGASGGGSSACPPNLAIPALCRVCASGSCGSPSCSNGAFVGFVCPEDTDAGTGGGGTGGVCNLACVKGKHCALIQPPCLPGATCSAMATCVDDADAGTGGTAPSCGGIAGIACPGQGTCVDVPNDGCDPMNGGADCPGMCACQVAALCAQGSTWNGAPDVCACEPTSGLHWVMSCGTPVCSATPGNYDSPTIPNCTTQKQGDPCTTNGDRCDGVFGCGATLLCATQAPTTCPISRARYKQDVAYLDRSEREQYAEQVEKLPLASYRYKNAPDQPQLGFIIEDVEPSVAVAGDHVNLYGYMSMAVAAIQVQNEQIKSLRQEVSALRAQLEAASSSQLVCEPPSR